MSLSHLNSRKCSFVHVGSWGTSTPSVAGGVLSFRVSRPPTTNANAETHSSSTSSLTPRQRRLANNQKSWKDQKRRQLPSKEEDSISRPHPKPSLPSRSAPRINSTRPDSAGHARNGLRCTFPQTSLGPALPSSSMLSLLNSTKSADDIQFNQLASLDGSQVVALVTAWVLEAKQHSAQPLHADSWVSELEQQGTQPYHADPQSMPASASSGGLSASPPGENRNTLGSGLLAKLPIDEQHAARARLDLLADAVLERQGEGRDSGSSPSPSASSAPLTQQQLADVVWGLSQIDRDADGVNRIRDAMGLPFELLPGSMPFLNLEELVAEVKMKRDIIFLDGGKKPVEESRLTGWQSDIGATFIYSGKEMQPQDGGTALSPWVTRVRDAVKDLTGVQYDSVLINYYEDGRCGMRYHVDPLYGKWTPDTSVVSIGSTRKFVFRKIEDFSSRLGPSLLVDRLRNGTIPTPAGSIPSDGIDSAGTGAIPTPAGSIPSDGIDSAGTGAIPTPAGSIPSDGIDSAGTGAIPTPAGSIPSDGIDSAGTGAIPTPAGSIPSDGIDSAGTGAIPTPAGSIPSDGIDSAGTGAIPTPAGSIPSDGIDSAGTGAIPTPAGSILSDGIDSAGTGAIPTPAGSIPF
eukprot:gene15481-21567_t